MDIYFAWVSGRSNDVREVEEYMYLYSWEKKQTSLWQSDGSNVYESQNKQRI